jgi:aspartyl-tRNA(Asn)/glutamyl-tRNA(Gln) amidotransferase subunit A
MMRIPALEYATIEQLGALLEKKKVSPVELASLYLARIESYGPRLNAFLTVTTESAMAEARAAEREIFRGRYRGLLHGIPIAVKDNFWTRGVRTTAGSTILRDFVPPEDAAAVRRLRRAGAVLLGKSNMHEFAFGITGENPHYGATRNPWRRELISGGSSGGSAAAVAAGLCVASVGTDTGGSIRVPAALCGIIGLKPTFGRISRYGVVPLALSFDHVSVLARSVADAGVMLKLLSGYDRRDAGSVRVPRSARGRRGGYLSGAASRRKKLRLGWPREFFWEQLDPEVRRLTEAAVRSLTRQGAMIEEISLPTVAAGVEAASVVAMAEANAYHQSVGYFPARAAEYGEDVRQRLTLGGELRAPEYIAAQATIRQARTEFDAALTRVDAIVAPATAIAASEIGRESVPVGDAEESVRNALVRLNRPANFTGLPAISVPCGFTGEGLPVGLQIIGRAFGEAALLGIADRYERQHPWRNDHPSLREK